MKKEDFEYLQRLLETLEVSLNITTGKPAILLDANGRLRLQIPWKDRFQMWEFDNRDYDLSVSDLANRIITLLHALPG